MGITFAKKELEKKRAKKKQDKAEKMQERKANNDKGKGLNDMMAYIDENGNISDTPPQSHGLADNGVSISHTGIAAPREAESPEREGIVSFFNDAKGYGFITDNKTRENVFVHVNQTQQPIKERDKVSYERERGPKGYTAVRVKIIQ